MEDSSCALAVALMAAGFAGGYATFRGLGVLEPEAAALADVSVEPKTSRPIVLPPRGADARELSMDGCLSLLQRSASRPWFEPMAEQFVADFLAEPALRVIFESADGARAGAFAAALARSPEFEALWARYSKVPGFVELAGAVASEPRIRQALREAAPGSASFARSSEGAVSSAPRTDTFAGWVASWATSPSERSMQVAGAVSTPGIERRQVGEEPFQLSSEERAGLRAAPAPWSTPAEAVPQTQADRLAVAPLLRKPD